MGKWIKLVIVAAMLAASQSPLLQAAEKPGKVLYTQVNIYSLKGEVVTWVNYGVDTLIPVNTEVVVTKVSGSSVTFKLKESGQILKLKNKERHSGLSGKAWADKHFAGQKVDLTRFSKAERDAIEASTVRTGMSRDAVIVARGYPPAHKTPNLNASPWLYWNTRWDKIAVTFGSDGKVSGVRN